MEDGSSSVLVPKYMTLESGQLVWKQSVSKGTIVMLQDGDMGNSLSTDFHNSARLSKWLTFAEKTIDFSLAHLIPTPIQGPQASFLLRQDVSRGDKVVVFSIFNEDDAPKFRNVQENTKFATQDISNPNFLLPSPMLAWILAQRRIGLLAEPSLQIQQLLQQTFMWPYSNQSLFERPDSMSNTFSKPEPHSIQANTTLKMKWSDKKTNPTSQKSDIPEKILTPRRRKTMLPCCVCGKSFDRPSLLKRHMRTHTGEKPHICQVCNKGFSTSSSLNTHKRIHSGEKPHQCNVCGKRFTASSNLYYHKMTHNKEKPHKCSNCDKSFSTPGDLKSHQFIHNGSWPFRCHVCQRGFSKHINVKNHLLAHISSVTDHLSPKASLRDDSAAGTSKVDSASLPEYPSNSLSTKRNLFWDVERLAESTTTS